MPEDIVEGKLNEEEIVAEEEEEVEAPPVSMPTIIIVISAPGQFELQTQGNIDPMTIPTILRRVAAGTEKTLINAP